MSEKVPSILSTEHNPLPEEPTPRLLGVGGFGLSLMGLFVATVIIFILNPELAPSSIQPYVEQLIDVWFSVEEKQAIQ